MFRLFLYLSFLIVSFPSSSFADEHYINDAGALESRLLVDSRLDIAFIALPVQLTKRFGDLYLICKKDPQGYIRASLVLNYVLHHGGPKGHHAVRKDVVIADNIFLGVSPAASVELDFQQAHLYSEQIAPEAIPFIESVKWIHIENFVERGIPWVNTWLETNSGVVMDSNKSEISKLYLSID